MIQLKNSAQLKQMRVAGRITAEALLVAEEHVKPGISTKFLDTVIHDYIVNLSLRISRTRCCKDHSNGGSRQQG